MKIKQNIIILMLAVFVGVFNMSSTVFAESGTQLNRDNETSVPEVDRGTVDTKEYCGSTVIKEGQSCSNGVVTSIIKCDSNGSGKVEDSCVWSLLHTAINIMTAGIGLLAVAGIVYASILYTSSGSSPDQAKQAIKIIQNVVIGLVAYLFMYSFLNYIIPGGVF